MAAAISDKTTSECGVNNTNQLSVVILDSDEEEEQTTDELFQAFIKAVQPFLQKKEILLLSVKFGEIHKEYASCPTFREMLRRKANQVRKTDVYIHFNEVLKKLITNAALYGQQASKQRESEVKTIGEVTYTIDTNNGHTVESVAGKFETSNNEKLQQPSTSLSELSCNSETQIIELDCEAGSSNSQNQRLIRKKLRKDKILKLEKKLEYISNEIKRLTQSELSLEEMNFCDSSYIKESRLKEQFNKLWEKICYLKGRPPNTGRVVEHEIRVKETNFKAIDRAIKRFLKKKNGFPDIYDIRNIVIKANKKKSLGLTQSVVQEIAADIFTDIGNKIQKKRKKDYEYNFGCHLTDDCLPSLDPALNDNELRRKLDENKKKGQNKLEEVFRKYVHMDRISKTQDNSSDSTPCNSDNDSSDNESYYRRKRKFPELRGGEENSKEKRARYSKEKSTTNTTSVNKKKSDKDIQQFPVSLTSTSTSNPPSCSSKVVSIEVIDLDDDTSNNVSPCEDPKSNSQSILSDNQLLAETDCPVVMSTISKSQQSEFNGVQLTSISSDDLCEELDKTANKSNVSHDAKTSINIEKHDNNSNENTEETQTSMNQCSTKAELKADLMAHKTGFSTWKQKVNESKLHLKIHQLKVEKLLKVNNVSEEGQLEPLESIVHHKRKSQSPHQLLNTSATKMMDNANVVTSTSEINGESRKLQSSPVLSAPASNNIEDTANGARSTSEIVDKASLAAEQPLKKFNDLQNALTTSTNPKQSPCSNGKKVSSTTDSKEIKANDENNMQCLNAQVSSPVKGPAKSIDLLPCKPSNSNAFKSIIVLSDDED